MVYPITFGCFTQTLEVLLATLSPNRKASVKQTTNKYRKRAGRRSVAIATRLHKCIKPVKFANL